MKRPYHGFIQAYVHHGRVGVLVEFGVETDFAARTPEFLQVSQDIAMHIAGMNPADVESLLTQPFARDQTRTVATVLADAAALLKESIVIRRFIRWDSQDQSGQHSVPPRSPVAPPRGSEGIAQPLRTRR